METPDTVNDAERVDFNGAWLKNADRIRTKRSIVICGISRGGTSFAASAFGQLGVPFSRRGERDIGRRYEHRELRAAFVAKDGEAIRRISTGFSSEYDVWAWKLPAIQKDFAFVAEHVPNPHFVIIFKEPLSVAVRKMDLKGKETVKALQQVLSVYQQMATIALETEHPLLLVSYDRAMAKLETFLADAARFAGIEQYDFEKVAAGIREDGVRYFRTPRERPVEKAPADDVQMEKASDPPIPAARAPRKAKLAKGKAAKRVTSYL